MNGERRSSRRTLAAVLALVLVFASACVVIASGPTPLVAPANPQFVSYIQSLSSGLPQEITADGHALGLVPLPVNLPKIKPKAAAMRSMALVGLPTTYDLRTRNKLTDVRDQGSCGACWAFATYGSLESSLRPNETWDFSENNMKNTSGFDLSPCAGGNQLMAAAYLARWSGPVDELDDPYNPNSGESPPTTTVQKHLQEVDFIPDRTGPLDNDAIRRAVMTYGAVYTCLYWGGGYDAGNFSYYYSGTMPINHAVCIAGWDDNFDRSRFTTPPPGNGAFLCKNSWGLGWGDAGYFWISYYDTKAGTENALFEFAEPTINYDHAYQYDPLGWTRSAGYGTETAWFANVFTAVNEESLNAVSFYTPVPGSSYTVYGYLNPSNGPTDPSGPVATTTGTIADPGYHTVQLDPSVTLHPGDTFSVVVSLNTPGYTYPIPLEAVSAGYSGGATANSRESFISSDGDTWSDATTFMANANVCLKAFTADRANLLVSPATSLIATGPTGGPFTQTSQTYTLTNIGSDDLGWTAVANQSWVSLSALSGTLAPNESATVIVSLDPGVAAFDPGAYTDTVQFINETSGIGSTSRTVSLLIKDGCLSVTPATGSSSSGGPGGPFSPSSFAYTLTNAGCGQIAWTANQTQPWVTLSTDGGYLQPGERVDVVVSVNANAESLPTGDYSDTVTFHNTTNGDGDTTRNAHLSIIRNYEISQAQFSWIDPNAHGSFILTDDGVTSPLAIPFNFSSYGTTYNQVYVGANGLLGFTNSGLTEYGNTDIPDPTAPNAAIYPYWDDLDPSVGGTIRIGTEGTAPNRKLVVTWNEVPFYTSGLPVTFQAILCETTGDIIFQYKEIQQGDDLYGAGRSATIGIENADGSLAAKYSFNGSSLVQNGQAISFHANRNVTIAEAIRMANGVGCTIKNAVVTATPATSLFYIEAEDRSCGISIYKSSHGISAGTVVNIQGTVSTNTSGERFVNATSVTPIEGEITVKPLLMSNARIGGGDWYYDPGAKSGQKGIAGAVGMNNIGLYITTTGRVTFCNATYFYIKDGSRLQDNSVYAGVKVLGTVPVAQGEDPVGKYVIVTGISSCFKGNPPDTNLYRLIRSTQVQVVD